MPIALTPPSSPVLRPMAGVLSFQIVAVVLAMLASLALGLAAGVTGGTRGTGLIAAIATAVFLLGGLPHGAFDIHLAAASARLGRAGLAAFTVIYVGLFAAMLIGWAIAPALVLPLFLASAAVHFGADWPETREPLFRIALGFAPLCAIGVGHLDQVELIFAAMTSPAIALLTRDLLILTAPVCLAVGAIALIVIGRGGPAQRGRAEVFALMLGALFIVPPLIGFALYFCAFHTPRHLIELRAQLGDWPARRMVAVGFGMTGLALLAGVIAVPLILHGGVLTAASGFQLLAALAMPHQSMKFILARLGSGTRGQRRAVQTFTSGARR